MAWIEQCAFISASRLRAPHILTAAIDSLVVVRPTRIGDILYVTSQVRGSAARRRGAECVDARGLMRLTAHAR